MPIAATVRTTARKNRKIDGKTVLLLRCRFFVKKRVDIWRITVYSNG